MNRDCPSGVLRFWTIAASALSRRAADNDNLHANDYDAFADWAACEGIAGLLLWKCPDWAAARDLAPRLLDAARKRVALTAAEERELQRVLEASAVAGLSPVLLKGAALAHTVYPDPALRPRRDTDVIVREQDEPVMRLTLERMGYARELEASGRYVTAQFHYVREDHGIRFLWDVHLKISNVHAYANRLTYDELRSDAISLAGFNGALVPSIVHSLVIACIHRVAHHAEHDEMLWLFDIHLLGESLSPADWDRLVALAETKQLSAVILRGLVRAQETFNTSLRAASIQRLAAGATREPSPQLVGGRTRTVDVFLSDIRSLPDWPARMRLVREHLFPPRAYMRRLYADWNATMLPIAYVHRLLRGGPKWFRRKGGAAERSVD